jgi:hypothetical protein
MEIVMVRLVAALSFLAIAGCYSPSVAPCVYRCNGEACPSGLTCNSSINMCVANAGDSCNGDAAVPFDDAAADAIPADATQCGWPGLSNVDPCELGAATTTASWSASGTVDTDVMSSFIGQDPVDVTLSDGTHALALALATFSVIPGQSLKVVGEKPLIIVASTVMIAGPITVSGTIATKCTGVGNLNLDGFSYVPSLGGTQSDGGSSGGGGGGGYGASGGDGGSGRLDANVMNATEPGGGAGGSGGSSPGHDELVPLRGGCPGGKGGFGSVAGPAVPGGPGGKGGGAIQISSKMPIMLSSSIIANGSGGGGVSGEHAGGGGGGSGGAILLEAPSIIYSGTALLCANGGGGGTGGNAGHDGKTSPDCGIAPGGMGVDGDNAAGGAGGFTSDLGKRGGKNGDTPTTERTPAYGGGGGGGGIGKIRVNGTPQGAATSSPDISYGALGG